MVYPHSDIEVVYMQPSVYTRLRTVARNGFRPSAENNVAETEAQQYFEWSYNFLPEESQFRLQNRLWNKYTWYCLGMHRRGIPMGSPRIPQHQQDDPWTWFVETQHNYSWVCCVEDNTTIVITRRRNGHGSPIRWEDVAIDENNRGPLADGRRVRLAPGEMARVFDSDEVLCWRLDRWTESNRFTILETTDFFMVNVNWQYTHGQVQYPRRRHPNFVPILHRDEPRFVRDWNFAVAGNNRLDGDGNYYVFLTPSDGLSSTSSSLFGTAYDDMEIESIPAAREVDEDDNDPLPNFSGTVTPATVGAEPDIPYLLRDIELNHHSWHLAGNQDVWVQWPTSFGSYDQDEDAPGVTNPAQGSGDGNENNTINDDDV